MFERTSRAFISFLANVHTVKPASSTARLLSQHVFCRTRKFSTHSRAHKAGISPVVMTAFCSIVSGLIGYQYCLHLGDKRDYLDNPQYGSKRDFEEAIKELRTIFPSRNMVSTDPFVLESHGVSAMNSYHQGWYLLSTYRGYKANNLKRSITQRRREFIVLDNTRQSIHGCSRSSQRAQKMSFGLFESPTSIRCRSYLIPGERAWRVILLG